MPPEHFTFANPWWLILIPLSTFYVLWMKRHGNEKSSITLSSVTTLRSLQKARICQPNHFQTPLLLLALTFGILALARPQLHRTLAYEQNQGIDIIIALDLSYSMIITDFYHNDDRSTQPIMRLDAAKRVLRTFIEKRPSDRIGIVAFSGRPYNLSPVTIDHNWLHQRLNAIQAGDIKEQGTAIGSAIAASGVRLADRNSKSKVMILITDGASNTGKIDPVEAAMLAADLEIKIYTIAIGTKDGRVPSSIQSFPKQEFDVPTLQQIASETGGEFFRARSMQDLEKTFHSIDSLEKSKTNTKPTILRQELFAWCAGGMVLFSSLLLLLRSLYPSLLY